jgi:hypothetical protein
VAIEFDVEDMRYSLFSEYDSFEKKKELKYAQVFIQMPYLLGNNMYALGNEYYMRRRNLHRYNLETNTWSIVF